MPDLITSILLGATHLNSDVLEVSPEMQLCYSEELGLSRVLPVGRVRTASHLGLKLVSPVVKADASEQPTQGARRTRLPVWLVRAGALPALGVSALAPSSPFR